MKIDLVPFCHLISPAQSTLYFNRKEYQLVTPETLLTIPNKIMSTIHFSYLELIAGIVRMAEGWRGGIGKFPPNPKAKKKNFPRAAKPRVGNSNFLLRDEEGIVQYLRAISKLLTLY